MPNEAQENYINARMEDPILIEKFPDEERRRKVCLKKWSKSIARLENDIQEE